MNSGLNTPVSRSNGGGFPGSIEQSAADKSAENSVGDNNIGEHFAERDSVILSQISHLKEEPIPEEVHIMFQNTDQLLP